MVCAFERRQSQCRIVAAPRHLFARQGIQSGWGYPTRHSMAACSAVRSDPKEASLWISVERRLYLMTSTRRVRFKVPSFGTGAVCFFSFTPWQTLECWVYNLRQIFRTNALLSSKHSLVAPTLAAQRSFCNESSRKRRGKLSEILSKLLRFSSL